jgi:hypothetical protein
MNDAICIEILHLEVEQWDFGEEKSAKSFQLLPYPNTGVYSAGRVTRYFVK